jgi:hypothetical protein
MKGTRMTTNWRTIQLFLSEEGVCEVEADADDYSRMKCSCPGFSKVKRCAHTKHVKKRIEDNNGVYSIRLPEDLTEEELAEAMESSESFRQLIVRYAKIEVLD